MDWLMTPDTIPQKFAVMFVAILLFAVVMGVVLIVAERSRSSKWVPVGAYLGPALLLIVFGLLWPGLTTIRNSFLDGSGEGFVGLDNYVRIFTDRLFLTVLGNTALWVVLVPLASTALGLVYAVLVDRSRFEKFAKTLIFLPMAISMVGASIIWKFVYEYKPPGTPQVGLLNQLLVTFGAEPRQYLLDPPQNTLFLILVMVWIQTGFAMTVLSAAIKGIPDEIVEAAQIDGVTGGKLFFYVTIPSVRPALVVVITTVAMATLKAFDVVRTMTGGQFDTSVIANEFYVQSFVQNQPQIGAALAVLLFIIILPIVIYNVRQMRISEGER